MIQSYTLVDYLQQADLLLEAEKARLDKCLCWPDFDAKLLAVFQEEILMKYQIQLLNNENGGIQVLFAQDKFDSLKLLYKLYCPIQDGMKPISDKFKLQLIQKGTEMIKAVETTSQGKEISVKTILVNS